jgi:hypothetical protein
MKPILATAITLATISSAAFHRQTAAQQSDSSVTATAKRETPFACNRLALSPEQRKRHFDELGPALRSLGMGVRELPDGFEFKFPADVKTYQLLSEWAAGERLCCPFFDIELRSEREGGPVWLRLTGRDGIKPFIAADFVKWFHP